MFQDSPKNGKIEYELMNHKEEFSVDPVTGIVTSRISFDYEQTDLVELKIRAKNPNDPSLFAETVLKVSIDGENEFFPKFRQPVFQFAVSESAQIGDIVGQVNFFPKCGYSKDYLFYGHEMPLFF